MKMMRIMIIFKFLFINNCYHCKRIMECDLFNQVSFALSKGKYKATPPKYMFMLLFIYTYVYIDLLMIQVAPHRSRAAHKIRDQHLKDAALRSY